MFALAAAGFQPELTPSPTWTWAIVDHLSYARLAVACAAARISTPRCDTGVGDWNAGWVPGNGSGFRKGQQ